MKLEDVILIDTRANQPAATDVPVGTLFCVTDEDNIVERSNGTTWDTYSPTSGSGGITSLTGDVTATGPGAAAATIANDAVTYAKMQNVSVTARALGRNTAGAGNVEEVTLTQILDWIGSAAQGDILYRGAASWARLGAGTAGQFLKTNGAAADPEWADAGGGGAGWTLIDDQPASGPVVDFEDVTIDDFSELLLVGVGITTDANSTINFQVSIDAGVSYLEGSGDYKVIAADGTETNDTDVNLTDNTVTAARTCFCIITNSNGTTDPKLAHDISGRIPYRIPTTSPIQAIRFKVTNTGAQSFNGGTFYVFGR